MSVHDGHRKRLRNRFLNEGLDNFEEINALELLLFYCIPRIDTNEIAHRLLDEFGSFPKVLEASVNDLKKVEGIGDNAATFLSLLNACNRFYRMRKVSNIKNIKTRDQYVSFLEPMFTGIRNERIYILCLDGRGKILCRKLIAEGSITAVVLHVRKIVEVALSVGAVSVVLAHNHPAGYALPSADDSDMTIRVAKALKDVDVELIDHIIFADSDFTSCMATNFQCSDFG